MKFVKGIPLNKIYLNYPRNPCIVGTRHGGITNLMPASWNSPISFNPPIYGVAIAPERFTFNLVKESGCFSLSYFPIEMWQKVAYLGSHSGRDVNKIEACGIEIAEGVCVPVPVPLTAIVCFECSLLDMHLWGDHYWVVGKVEGAHFNENFVINEKDILFPDLSRYSPLLYMGRQRYLTISNRVLIPERQK